MGERVWVDGWGVVDLMSRVSNHGGGDSSGSVVEVDWGSSNGGNSSCCSQGNGHQTNTTGGNAHDDAHCDCLRLIGVKLVGFVVV